VAAAAAASAVRSNTGDYGIDCWYKGLRQRVEFDASETDAERARTNEIFDAVMVIFAPRQHGCGVTAIRKGILLFRRELIRAPL
jgi:hypothetical protein